MTNRHFANHVEDDLKSIKRDAEWLFDAGWHGVWKWVQKKANSRGHHKGIAYVLHTMKTIWHVSHIKNPWAYAEATWKIKEPHYWERDHLEKDKLVKEDFNELIQALEQVLGRGK